MAQVMDWLLEYDTENPGVRYFALRDLLEEPADAPDVIAARQALMESGPVPVILSAQDTAGFWEKPGAGYYPKYRGTAWSLIYLAQLGADPGDPRVLAGGEYLLANSLASNGAFSMSGTPSGNIACLNGNLGAALLDLGFLGDERLTRALDTLGRFTTGEGVAPSTERKSSLHYLRSGSCGPDFRCSANDRQPCAWGAVKVLLALARLPEGRRSPIIQAALAAAVDFLFSVDPATAGYPAGYSDKPSRSWFKFGFPVFYVTDILQIAEVLSEAGHGGDERLAGTYEFILDKRDSSGRWSLEYTYQGKTWADIEAKGKPSKWVTLRALRVLKGGGFEA
jgi:hypothetical protein